MVRFEALEHCIDLIAALAPHLDHIAKRNGPLADQLRRAATSTASCLAEGSRRIGKDRWHLYRTAEGSAAEVHTQLRIAVALGYFGPDELQPLVAAADRVTALCFGLTRDHRKGG